MTKTKQQSHAVLDMIELLDEESFFDGELDPKLISSFCAVMQAVTPEEEYPEVVTELEKRFGFFVKNAGRILEALKANLPDEKVTITKTELARLKRAADLS